MQSESLSGRSVRGRLHRTSDGAAAVMGGQDHSSSGLRDERRLAALHHLHGREEVEGGEAAGGEGRIRGRELLPLRHGPVSPGRGGGLGDAGGGLQSDDAGLGGGSEGTQQRRRRRRKENVRSLLPRVAEDGQGLPPTRRCFRSRRGIQGSSPPQAPSKYEWAPTQSDSPSERSGKSPCSRRKTRKTPPWNTCTYVWSGQGQASLYIACFRVKWELDGRVGMVVVAGRRGWRGSGEDGGESLPDRASLCGAAEAGHGPTAGPSLRVQGHPHLHPRHRADPQVRRRPTARARADAGGGQDQSDRAGRHPAARRHHRLHHGRRDGQLPLRAPARLQPHHETLSQGASPLLPAGRREIARLPQSVRVRLTFVDFHVILELEELWTRIKYDPMHSSQMFSCPSENARHASALSVPSLTCGGFTLGYSRSPSGESRLSACLCVE